MALPSSEPPSRPAPGAAARDLSDAEFAELGDLLAGVPEPLQPLDPFMLDGFLAAVVVLPRLVEPESWLPYVFDADGHRWGEAEATVEQARARALVLRRLGVLNRSLAEFGGFDPWIPPLDEPVEEPAVDGPPSEGAAAAPADPVARALLPWAAGFAAAAELFPDLHQVDDARADAALAVVYRHLPDDDAPADDGQPSASSVRGLDLDREVAELVDAVAVLYDVTAPLRFRVDAVRRDVPKIGRNDPCHCGSGRKFKRCHGVG